MASSEIANLRSQVRQAHRRATAKVSRLRSKGVEVGGSSIDPRRDVGKVKGYTKAQLNSQLSRLNAFNSRTNAVIPNTQGGFLNPSKVAEYRRTQSAFNAKARRQYSKVADIPLPGRGMNVREADAMDRPSIRTRGYGQAVARPFEPVNRSLRNVTDDKALDKLTAQLKGKLDKNYGSSRLSAQRVEFMEMMNSIGNIKDREAAMELTDYQFNVLFNYNASVVNEISMRYELVKLKSKGEQEEFQERIDESAAHRVSNAITWAGQLKPKRGKK